ncbi:hemolysin activation/secretion protein [Lutibacter sp. Hel_I_33_5]|uniref:metallophosphoesterase n=1 Tax=Lutibacter sp. Hel_I_33_5 TaxID=1566289 RepID=UPI0011A3477E|nr:metallophosphoesterase [Lutibacter sp. Hel_I_33_5]TVZ55011.1 hemolysin activation/secretion protein [Lutibacter sp. Hel_I_33_5]
MKINSTIFLKVITLLLFSGCATFKPQYSKSNIATSFPDKELEHSFYLIGDGGNSPLGTTTKTLKAFRLALNKAPKNSTAIFLGDNIYEDGMPKKGAENREFAEHQLNTQAGTAENFKGNAIFIPGNHDWYSGGIKGVKRQEKYVEAILGKKSFLPENGCPIENIHISKDIELILIDTQWYIENWDKHPTINAKCDIKTRARFFDEYKSLIKKSRGKTTIVALHHPMYTNGPHGGQYSCKDYMKPLPLLGSLKNMIRKTGGVVNTDLQNKIYGQLKKRIITISQENKKVVFVSGHEHSLQYIIEDNLHQIISGSGSKVSPTRNIGGGQFSYGTSGYARLDVFKDGSSFVSFFSADDDKIVYQTEVLKPNQKKDFTTYPINFPKEKAASIYSKEETTKSSIYKFLWGNRYRNVYSTPVKAPTVNLDTLYGGVSIVRKGGGNQSRSLRLKTKTGAQYVMRALRKNAVQYLQAVMFKDQYIEGQFNNTETEDFLLDVFAGSHPYAPFTIGDLSDAAGVYHTNPKLYYIPKQNALGSYNNEFGDELYMIEEHTSEGHSELASFGHQNKLLSTDDVMKKLHKDVDFTIDEASYIRARLFDMLIGDWDRHQDQWRWIEFKENGKKVYRPMPRDRDQAFSIMSDGFLLNAAVKLLPVAGLLRKYDDDLVDVKGVNVEPYPLDMEFIQQADKTVWDAQVKKIQDGVTDAVIEKAFLNFPKEVRDQNIDEIKRTLKARRGNLQKISDRYYKLVNSFSVLKGTNKDDYFTITCNDDGSLEILVNTIKKGEKGKIFHQRTYDPNETKEIWIYGLDDEDVFEVLGKSTKIKIRLIGGQHNDTYKVLEGGKVFIYDYTSKKNTITEAKKARIKLTDDYETNVYDYKKLKNSLGQFSPTIGSNPDDGLKVGVNYTYTSSGFERNPFTTQHIISSAYYFATSGYELGYKGEFTNVFGNYNLGIEATFNSPNYAMNFFGFGNSTENHHADTSDGIDVDRDYNRIKIRTFKLKPSLIWNGNYGASFIASVFYESNEVDRTNNRFLAKTLPINHVVFDQQDFYGGETFYGFRHKDNEAFPTLGMQFGLLLGYKNNVSTSKGFGYLNADLGFDYKLVSSGLLVLATNLSTQVNLGEGFEFYQAANLGASNGLRGYRNQRFTGKSAFVQSTDIRWNFTRLKTNILPISLGFYGGFDYGSVWIDNKFVTNPSLNQNKWNTSVGGGFFINLADMMTANLSAFNSEDGMRIGFQFGFGF